MLSVEPVGDPAFGVDFVENHIGVFLLAGCENHDLEDFGHFEEERVEAEPFDCVGD